MVQIFYLSSVPPSVNSLYGINYRARRPYLKPEVLAWKSKVKSEMPSLDFTVNPAADIVRVDMVFWYPWRHGNGRLRQWDAANCHKPLIDAIAERYGWKSPADACVKFGSWGSVDSVETKTKVTIELM